MGRVYVLSVLTVLIFGCAPPAGPDAFDDASVDPFVAAHNAVRAAAVPAPSPPLPDLVWSTDVAATAQAWSQRCVFEHSHGPLGENLAFFSGDASTVDDVVNAWASETEFYDYATNSCAANQQCGHYTQIVWRDTTTVGCGAATCTVDGTVGLFWVCNYDPPGNFVGESPY